MVVILGEDGGGGQGGEGRTYIRKEHGHDFATSPNVACDIVTILIQSPNNFAPTLSSHCTYSPLVQSCWMC